jgi:sigma-B regulation protein RsbU (phosphoserine phosphatase)
MVKSSLTTRMILWVTFGVITIFTVVSTYDYFVTKELLNTKIRQSAEFEVSSSEATSSDILDKLQNQADLTAALIQQVSPVQAKLEQMIQTAMQQNEYIYGMAVVVDQKQKSESYASYFYRENEAVKYVNLASADYDYRSKQWYKKAQKLGSPGWTEPYFDQGAGNVWMTTYLVPFIKDGNFTLITIDIAVSTIHSILTSMETKKDMSIYAITPNGHVITGKDETMMLQKLYEIELEKKDLPEWFLTMLDEIRAKKSGSFATFCTRTQDNCWVSYAPLGDTQWTLLVSYSHASLTKQLNTFTQHRVAQLSLGVILLIWVIYIVTKRQFLPLKELDKATQEFSQGNLNYILPPSTKNDEIGSLTQSFSKMQVSLNSYIEELKYETQQRERINGELRTASKIQESLLPDDQELINKHLGIELSAYLKPAREVGGDLYYYNLQEEGKFLCFVIGDVSDKGIAAAIFMARVVTGIRIIIEQTNNPGKTLTQLNKLLVEDNDACMFVTLLAGRINLQTGELQLASAGHPMPYYLRSEAPLEQIEQLSGPALGFYPYEFECLTMILEKGSSLFAYTDGLDEAVNKKNEQYGDARIAKSLKENMSTTTSELISKAVVTLNDFVGDTEPVYDLTFLAIRWEGINKIYKKEIHIKNKKEELFIINQALADYICEYQLPEPMLMNLELIAEEIIVNVINYGYAEDNQPISLLIDHDENLIRMTFVDSASAFNPLDRGDARLGLPDIGEPVGGLGVHLVKETSDECTYEYISGENRFTVSCYLTK